MSSGDQIYEKLYPEIISLNFSHFSVIIFDGFLHVLAGGSIDCISQTCIILGLDFKNNL